MKGRSEDSHMTFDTSPHSRHAELDLVYRLDIKINSARDKAWNLRLTMLMKDLCGWQGHVTQVGSACIKEDHSTTDSSAQGHYHSSMDHLATIMECKHIENSVGYDL
jgi:hypothetical protein